MAPSLFFSAAAAARCQTAYALRSFSTRAGAALPPPSSASIASLPWSPASGVAAGAPACTTYSISRKCPASLCIPSSLWPAPAALLVHVGAKAPTAAGAAELSTVVPAATCRRAVLVAKAAAAAANYVWMRAVVKEVGKRFFSSNEGGRGAETAGGQQQQEGSHRTLEGRYAAVLLRAAKQQNQLHAIYDELTNLKELLQQSEDFRRFVETPALSAPQKQALLQQLCATYKLQPVTSNFLQTLLENGRLPLLCKVADAFDVLYRKERGEVRCLVSSAQPLNSQQQKEVEAALQKRAGHRAKLMIEYVVNPELMGGLVVRLGEQVLDFSVATRIDRLQAQLMAPV